MGRLSSDCHSHVTTGSRVFASKKKIPPPSPFSFRAVARIHGPARYKPVRLENAFSNLESDLASRRRTSTLEGSDFLVEPSNSDRSFVITASFPCGKRHTPKTFLKSSNE